MCDYLRLVPPIGRKVGPALEVREALKVMESMEGPNSLIEKSAALAGIMLEDGGGGSKRPRKRKLHLKP